MDAEMRKRLEEAAKIHSKCGNNCAKKDILGRKVCKKYCTEYNSFLSGAEHGYKEAIKVAKEWLKDSMYKDLSVGYAPLLQSFATVEHVIDAFENNMNKLWEE